MRAVKLSLRGVQARRVPAGLSAGLPLRRAVVGVRWTERQDDVIRECCFRGADYVAAEIFRRCGVERSRHAVEMRASRLGASLVPQTVCPACGAVGLKINRQSRMCVRCTELLHVEEQRAFAASLEAERAAALAEAEALRRENAALRKRRSRARARAAGAAAGAAAAGAQDE